MDDTRRPKTDVKCVIIRPLQGSIWGPSKQRENEKYTWKFDTLHRRERGLSTDTIATTLY